MPKKPSASKTIETLTNFACYSSATPVFSQVIGRI